MTAACGHHAGAEPPFPFAAACVGGAETHLHEAACAGAACGCGRPVAPLRGHLAAVAERLLDGAERCDGCARPVAPWEAEGHRRHCGREVGCAGATVGDAACDHACRSSEELARHAAEAHGLRELPASSYVVPARLAMPSSGAPSLAYACAGGHALALRAWVQGGELCVAAAALSARAQDALSGALQLHPPARKRKRERAVSAAVVGAVQAPSDTPEPAARWPLEALDVAADGALSVGLLVPRRAPRADFAAALPDDARHSDSEVPVPPKHAALASSIAERPSKLARTSSFRADDEDDEDADDRPRSRTPPPSPPRKPSAWPKDKEDGKDKDKDKDKTKAKDGDGGKEKDRKPKDRDGDRDRKDRAPRPRVDAH
jgi:hypothetical protein